MIVYSGRPLDQTGAGETAYQAAFTAGGTVTTLTWDPNAQNTPDVAVGGWILDGTMQPDPHGYFYRVVGVTAPAPSPTQPGWMVMDVEVQTPLRGTGSTSTGVVVIMDNVVEVFERGTF